jgi:small subunit ribosomal protein S7
MRRRLSLKAKNKLSPDIVYNSVKVAKLINYVMRQGKKDVAKKIVYGALDDIKKETKRDSLEVFEEALKNAGPVVEVRSRRVGGANYQIPHEVSADRCLTLVLRWLVRFAKAKKGKPMREQLAAEIIAASKNEGEAVRKKETIRKMAEANRAFAHFARFSRPSQPPPGR